MRLAFASNDGKFVSQHFGRALKFVIVDINDDYAWNVVEVRENAAPCERGDHDSEALAASVELISDCNALLATKIGNYAHNLLRRRGVHPLEQSGFIEELIENYIKYLKRRKFTP
jgi:predicted Fe-Mo cluster-binding NifX family protein